jgi:hypothetical protein
LWVRIPPPPGRWNEARAAKDQVPEDFHLQSSGIFTSYYASRKLDRNKHFLVRTSIGSPRFLKCDCTMMSLAPERGMLGLDGDTYQRRYLALLEKTGAPAITAELRRITRQAAGKTPVLLCFEALRSPDQFCHRRMFAKWYEEKTGTVIPELPWAEPRKRPWQFK